MLIRQNRIKNDHLKLLTLSSSSEIIKIRWDGDPPQKYKITYNCKGLVKNGKDTHPSISEHHEIEIYLHKDYPRCPPQLKCLTNIFHPNMLPPRKNGGICIGGWSPAESLDNLCIRIGEMLQYKNYSETDILNQEAADWLKLNKNSVPLDTRPLLKEPIEIILG